MRYVYWDNSDGRREKIVEISASSLTKADETFQRTTEIDPTRPSSQVSVTICKPYALEEFRR